MRARCACPHARLAASHDQTAARCSVQRPALVVRAEFAAMVRLRGFVETTFDGDVVEWPHAPAPPLVSNVDGQRSVDVDRALIEADVSPVVDDDVPFDDASFEQFSDRDDDEARPKRARESPMTPPERRTATAQLAEEAEAASNMGHRAPCVRCGNAAHAASSCRDFNRDRGAQHSSLARQRGVLRDIGDDGSRSGMRSADIEEVADTPDVLYAAMNAALRGLGGRFTHAHEITRRQLCSWLKTHGETQVCGVSLNDWVTYECEKGWRRVAAYADWMLQATSYAGPLDCAAFAAVSGVSVHVWQRVPGGECFVRHAAIDPPTGASDDAVHILHAHGRHYDVLQPAQTRCRSRRAV